MPVAVPAGTTTGLVHTPPEDGVAARALFIRAMDGKRLQARSCSLNGLSPEWAGGARTHDLFSLVLGRTPGAQLVLGQEL